MDHSWAARYAPRQRPPGVPEQLTAVLFDLEKGTVRDILWDSWNEYVPAVLDPLVECGNSTTDCTLIKVNGQTLSLWYAYRSKEDERPDFAPRPAWRILGAAHTDWFYHGNALFLHEDVVRDTDCFHYTKNCPLTAAEIAPYVVRVIYDPTLLKSRSVGFATAVPDV
jgi:hypothetical protein